jgi:mannose-6-phosphate isomerase-like protein (cupin superfamily)
MEREQTTNNLLPRLVHLDANAEGYFPVLQGPPESLTMRSGYVTLPPKASVGKHSTGPNEELLVVLSGTGEMRFTTHGSLHLLAPCTAYCPPHTEHDVTNTGQEPLRYVYVVASVGSSRSFCHARRR